MSAVPKEIEEHYNELEKLESELVAIDLMLKDNTLQLTDDVHHRYVRMWESEQVELCRKALKLRKEEIYQLKNHRAGLLKELVNG